MSPMRGPTKNKGPVRKSRECGKKLCGWLFEVFKKVSSHAREFFFWGEVKLER